MYEFSYKQAKSIAEAATILTEDDEASWLAGGLSLLPAMKLHLAQYTSLVDLSKIDELQGISRSDDVISIGSMTRHVEVANSPIIQEAVPGLAVLAGGIGDRQVRNRGTIGGSVANCDPAACYPAGVLGLGAVIRTDQRSIEADDFFLGLFETALEPNEIIVGFDFPIPAASSYEKFRHPASRFALTGVFVSKSTDGNIRVAVTGAGPHVFRAETIETALTESFTVEAAEAIVMDPAGLTSDIHGDADYRAALISVLAGRAVEKILDGTNALLKNSFNGYNFNQPSSGV